MKEANEVSSEVSGLLYEMSAKSKNTDEILAYGFRAVCAALIGICEQLERIQRQNHRD